MNTKNKEKMKLSGWVWTISVFHMLQKLCSDISGNKKKTNFLGDF